MSLSKDNRPKRQGQTRGQKIALWCIYGIVAVLAIVAAIIFFASGTRLF